MEGKTCPSCGRYIGSLERCPYCGAKIPKHTAYYYAKYGSLSFAIIGIVFLLIFAQSIPVQYVKIGDITQTYNYAVVEIKGVVSSAPSLVIHSDGTSTLYINVDDGTGVMSVHVYSPVIGRLVEKNKVPGYGDFVKIIGNVYFRGDNIYMILNSPDAITINRAQPVYMNISEILAIGYPSANYMRVTLNVTVVSVYRTTSGSYVLNITDDTGYMDAYIPFATVYLTGNNVSIESLEGKTVQITGCIEWYGSMMSGEWEIIPATMSDVKVIS